MSALFVVLLPKQTRLFFTVQRDCVVTVRYKKIVFHETVFSIEPFATK